MIVSKARQTAHNGVYRKQTRTCNDRDVYEHASGACIFYDDGKSSWILTVSAEIQAAAYIRQSDDDDIVPPNGEWQSLIGSGKCYVKAVHCACIRNSEKSVAVHAFLCACLRHSYNSIALHVLRVHTRT